MINKISNSLNLFLIAAILVSGCGQKKEKIHPSSQELSLLQVSRLEIDSSIPVNSNQENLHQVSHRKVVVKACFVDAVTTSKLSGANFVIDADTVISDIEGCLFWSHLVAIPTNGSLNFPVFSKIVSLPNSQLSTEVKYQINPYDSKLINLKHSDGSQIAATKDDGASSYSIEKLNGSFAGFVSENGSSLRNQKFITNLDFCISSRSSLVDTKNLAGKKVNILIKNSNKVDIHSKSYIVDTQACLQISYNDSADMLGANSWKNRKLVVLIGNDSIERDYAINPIERKGEFFWDLRRGAAPSIATQEKPRLVVDKMRYTFIGNEDDGFNVNEFLEMSLVKSYQLEIEPKISYGHEFQGDTGPRTIYNGDFNLEFVLLAPKNGDMEITAQNLSAFEVLSKYKVKTHLKDGKISTNLKLPLLFTDLPKAVTRTLAIIRLSSIENPELSSVVTGPFHASTHQFSVGMREFESFESGDKLVALNSSVTQKLNESSPAEIDQKGNLKSGWKIKPIELYRELHKGAKGLEDLVIQTFAQFKNLSKIDLTKENLNSFIKGQFSGKDVAKFCQSIYPSKIVEGIFWNSTEQDPHFSSCIKSPEKYLDIKSVKHIQKILSKPERVYSSTDRINIGSGFFFFKTDSSRESWARRWSAGADLGMKLEIPFLKVVSAGGKVGYDISYMKSRDLSLGETSRGSLSRTRNIYADMLRLSFKANTLSCLNVQGKYIETSKGVTRSPKRFQICQDELKVETIEESWYYMGESDPTMSILRDRWSNKENMMIKLLRGQKNFEEFYNLMADDTKVVFLQKIETLKGPDAYFSRIYSKQDGSSPTIEDGAIPGVIEP